MRLKNYQEDAILNLLNDSIALLNYSDPKKLVFKAPTGSGKTIMMAEFLKNLSEDRTLMDRLSFIWAAPRQLHIQSKDKLEKYFENNRALKCSFPDDLDDIMISNNEILFFNWESINREDNLFIRDNEYNFNLTNVIRRTKDYGNIIILVIDESHHHATSNISQKLIRDIDPKLTIEVSATPVISNPDKMITVDLEDVKNEGMIKKAIILNENFINTQKNGKIESSLSLAEDSEFLTIRKAIEKHNELLNLYKEENSIINPLILIQLPDRIGQLEDTMKNRIIALLKDEFNISTENGKLAIWLSGQHINKENVEKDDSEVKVLIFKQAIALGWDCPRAHILTLFREWHSPVFSIQTVGRIMRMPNPSKGHYKNDVLNYSYVFTNLSNIEIKEDIAKDYISIHPSKRRPVYKNINLLSCHKERHREKTRLSPLFIELFLKISDKQKLNENIDISYKKLDMEVFNNWKSEDIDNLAGIAIEGTSTITSSSFDLNKLFDYFVRKCLSPFYPEDRSVGRVKEAIYKFFEINFNMKRGCKEDEVIQISLSNKNIKHLIDAIDETKEEYLKEVEKRKPEIVFDDKWNVPEILKLGNAYALEERNKSIMQPFFVVSGWQTEINFINLIDKPSNSIKWWFRNGARDKTFFAIPYFYAGEWHPFYIDFIIRTDKVIGLFDTKSGRELEREETKQKIKWLHKYIQTENDKGKNLIGGIITNTDPINFTGRWVYFDKELESYDCNNFANWTLFNF